MVHLGPFWEEVLPPRERDSYFGSLRIVLGGGFVPGGRGTPSLLILNNFGGCFAPGGRGTTTLVHIGSFLFEVLPPEEEGQQLWLI